MAMIEDRDLGPGTRLTARFKGGEHACEVVETPDGRRYRLADGREFRSPSGAGRAVMGHACNGWAFWSLAGTERPARETKAAAPAKPKKAAKPASKATGKTPAKGGGRKKAKPMKAASKGDGSYGCGACGETFPTMKAATEHALTHTRAD